MEYEKIAGDELTEDKASFVKISIACQQTLSAPTKASFEALNSVLKNYSSETIKANQSRILLTLLQIISKENIKSDIKLSGTLTLETILLKVPVISDFLILRSIIQHLIQILYDPQSSTLVASVPEELHLVSLNIIRLLLKNMTAAQQNKLYSPQAAPFLGVLVCLCLEEAGKQQFRKIKISAVECLMACGQVLDKAPDESDIHQRAGNIFMNFVPGIVKGLQQVINGDEKQGHGVTLVALRAWGRLIAQVMESPSNLSEDKNLAPKPLNMASNLSEIQEVFSKSKRTTAYFKMADQWLQGNVELICAAKSHSHHKVRLELISSACLILTKCSKNLPSCVVPLLEVLVTLSEDDVDEVADAATNALDAVTQVFDEETSLVEILEENLYRVAEQLPSVFSKKEERGQLCSLGLLVGYLQLLGHRLYDTLLLHQQVVLSSLMFVATFESGHVVLLEDMSIKDEVSELELRPWHQHKFFSSRAIHRLLQKACAALSRESHLIIPQLLSILVDKPAVRKEAVHLLNLVIASTTELQSAKSVAQSFVDPAVWDVPLWATGGITPAEAKSNVVLACLLCESLAVTTAAASTKSRHLLSVVLYPVLERAGSTAEIVSLSGRQALRSIAKTLGHPNTATLICKEAEYFTHFVTVRLRRPKDNPGALLVLCAVLQHGSSDILPSVELIINDVLMRCQDNKTIPSYVEVFLALINNISQFSQPATAEDTINAKCKSRPSKMSSVVEELILIEKLSQTSPVDSDDDTDEEPSVVQEDKESEQKVVPVYIKMTEAVLQRCLHMLPSRDKEIQILALRVIKQGLPILEPFEDQLLPLGHKLWSPLVQRFSTNQDVVILRQSFELLCIIASSSKSFIRHRCLEQVLPAICQFMETQAAVSAKQKGSLASQGMKLQKAALDKLGKLSEDLELQEKDVHLILKSCSPYLSCKQPLTLQESCISLFKFMTKINCDAVWLRLNSLWNNGKDLKPNCSMCSIIMMPPGCMDFKLNVETLMNFT